MALTKLEKLDLKEMIKALSKQERKEDEAIGYLSERFGYKKATVKKYWKIFSQEKQELEK